MLQDTPVIAMENSGGSWLNERGDVTIIRRHEPRHGRRRDSGELCDVQIRFEVVDGKVDNRNLRDYFQGSGVDPHQNMTAGFANVSSPRRRPTHPRDSGLRLLAWKK